MFGFFNVDFERFFNGKGFSIMELKIEEYFSINLVILQAVTNFKIFFFFAQPQTKKISHQEVVNTAGNNVLMVGVVLNEGMNNSAPTELEFTVNIPKTGYFNFVLRYMVRCSSLGQDIIINDYCSLN